MLRQLRSAEKIKKIIWVGLLLIIIPSFVAFYGWSDYSGSAGGQLAAPAVIDYGFRDNEEVTQADLERAENIVKNQLAAYSRNHGMMIDQAVVDRVADTKLVLDQALNLEMLHRYAKDNGIAVSTQEAIQLLQKQIPVEQRKMLDQQLKMQGKTLDQFIEMQRDNILMEKVRDIIGSQVRVTHYEAWLHYLLQNEKLVANFVKVDSTDYGSSVTLDDSEVKKYFESNIEKFRIPDQVQYAFVLVKKDDLKSSITLTEDEITSYYQNRQEEFRMPRSGKIRQVFLKRPTQRDTGTTAVEALSSMTAAIRAKANDIQQRAIKGEDFASLADQYSEETRFPPQDERQTSTTDLATTASDTLTSTSDNATTAGGMLGWLSEEVTRGYYGEEWTSSVFNLKTGAVSQVIDTQRGFFIAKLENVKEGLVEPLDKVRGQIENKLRDEKVEPLFQSAGKELQENADKFTGLDKLAEVSSTTLEVTDKVDRKATFIPQIGLLGDFAEAIQDLQKGGRSEVLSDNQRHLVIEVREEYPAHDPTQAEASEQVAASYRDYRAREIAREVVGKIKEKASDFETLKTAAVNAGLTVTRSRPFMRSEAQQVFTAPVVNFEEISARVKKGEVATTPIGSDSNPSGFVIWQLAEANEPSRADFAKELSKISRDLLSKKQVIVIAEFFRDQRKRFEDRIEINPAYR